MKKISLIPYFSLALFYQLSLPYFHNFFPILYFAPFFTLCFARKSLFFSLWCSFFIGLFLDFCTTTTPMGFYPICAIATTLLLHRLKIYFLEDKPFTFAIYSALYSFTYSIFFSLLYSFFDPKLSLSPLPFLLDTLFLPLLDGIYHILFFTMPILGYQYLTAREQKVRFLRMKKKLFTKWQELQNKVAR